MITVNDLWNVFATTGKVEDYLKYKQNEQKGNAEKNNEAFYQRVDYPRTDDRRER